MWPFRKRRAAEAVVEPEPDLRERVHLVEQRLHELEDAYTELLDRVSTHFRREQARRAREAKLALQDAERSGGGQDPSQLEIMPQTGSQTAFPADPRSLSKAQLRQMVYQKRVVGMRSPLPPREGQE